MRIIDWRTIVFTAAILAMPGGRVQCQAPTGQKFEVAVVRQDNAGPESGTSANIYAGGRVQVTNATMRWVIRAAFHLEDRQIAGGPAWLDNDRYDIEAKTGRQETPTPDQLQAMMQDLLAERFHLKCHRETREMQVYALVSDGKPAAGLKQSEDGTPTSMDTRGGAGSAQRLTAKGATLAQLSNYVGNRLGHFVVDRTGLSGNYDFSVEWTQGDAAESGLPSLVTALHEQLGLKLEQRKEPIEMLVIDSIDRPTEN